MGKPTLQELQQALVEAARMRENNQDPNFLAKSLLNLHYRIGFLEKVMRAADIYLRGESPQQHTVLQRAIDIAKKEDAHTAGNDYNPLFL